MTLPWLTTDTEKQKKSGQEKIENEENKTLLIIQFLLFFSNDINGPILGMTGIVLLI